MCRDVFPSSRCLFLYRDVVAVAKSFSRISAVDPVLRLVSSLGSLSDQMMKLVARWVGLIGSDFCVRLDNDLALGVLFCAPAISMYLDARRRGFDVRAVRYEDLVARPLDTCRIVLEFCHLPVWLAELAVTALDRDSQRNSFIAKSVVGRVKNPVLMPEKKAQLN